MVEPNTSSGIKVSFPFVLFFHGEDRRKQTEKGGGGGGGGAGSVQIMCGNWMVVEDAVWSAEAWLDWNGLGCGADRSALDQDWISWLEVCVEKQKKTKQPPPKKPDGMQSPQFSHSHTLCLLFLSLPVSLLHTYSRTTQSPWSFIHMLHDWKKLPPAPTPHP